jgi:RNase P subunit RPR2
MADGSERICPHPGEIQHAEEVTREKWATLVREKRIRYRYSMFCRECGAVDYYGAESPVKFTHVGNLVRTPAPEEAAMFRCRCCGKQALFPFVWGRGFFAGILEKTGMLREVVVTCPKCKSGKLKSMMTALS